MRIELSALIDGETEVHEARAMLAAMRSDPELRAAWSEYHLIGDVLRNEGRLSADVVSGVLQSLAEEPVVLAPVSRQPTAWQRPLAALAASLAGVAVVAWLALPSQTAPADGRLAAAKMPTAVASTTAGHDLQEYLLAHQANAPGLRLQGDRQNIRTVSVMEGGR